MRNISNDTISVMESGGFHRLLSAENATGFAFESSFSNMLSNRFLEVHKISHVVTSDTHTFDMRQSAYWNSLVLQCMMYELWSDRGTTSSYDIELPTLSSPTLSRTYRFEVEDRHTNRARIRCRWLGEEFHCDFYLFGNDNIDITPLFNIIAIYSAAGEKAEVTVKKGVLPLFIKELETYIDNLQEKGLTKSGDILKKTSTGKALFEAIEVNKETFKNIMLAKLVLARINKEGDKLFFKEEHDFFAKLYDDVRRAMKDTKLSPRNYPASYAAKYGLHQALAEIVSKITNNLQHGDVNVKAA